MLRNKGHQEEVQHLLVRDEGPRLTFITHRLAP
jgi:hypothetical protein